MPAMDYIAGNLIFIGLMGAGKTTIGKCLAQRLGWQFYDSDQEVVKRTGVPISTIFELEGEASFREREHAVISDLSQLKHCVIATGGGAILRHENRQLLQQSGTVIYLSTSVDCILKRTAKTNHGLYCKWTTHVSVWRSSFKSVTHSTVTLPITSLKPTVKPYPRWLTN